MNKVFLFLCLLLQAVLLNAKVYKGAEYRTKESYLYGRFEVRMMSSQREGMLSSFFTYNDTIPFDASKWNEIDIEILGRYTDDVQFNTITPGTTNHVGRRCTPFNPALGFHTYSIEWTPGYVAWFIDGVDALRQTGAHIQTLIHSQKIMMNIWIPTAPNWAGEWNDNVLPAFAYYDYVSYAAYTPGTGSVGSNNNFTPKWKDDFNVYDGTRWDKASHTWSDNQCDLIPDNIVFKDGCMILCLTKETATGYTDKIAPTVSSVRAEADGVMINFAEEVDSVSAVDLANYLFPNATVSQIDLLSNKKTVRFSFSGYDTSVLTNVIIMHIKDRFVPPNMISAISVNIAKARQLALPVKINCGGPAYKDYFADQIWNGT
ncbi:MAG: family 16 glycosylhydrolase, partial [Ignavibacteriales bacterium]|nr:family 16 glycosylhydrolase [Ignavibacteriales bacterium]